MTNNNAKSAGSHDDPVAGYVKLIRTAEALHSEVSRGLSAEGLTASQFSTLKVLHLRGAIPQKDIATYLLKTGGNVTVVVDNLERMGLVQRVRDTSDRRLVLVSLTDEGDALFNRIYPHHLERIRRAMSPLKGVDMNELFFLLERLHTTTGEPLCQDAGLSSSERAAS